MLYKCYTNTFLHQHYFLLFSHQADFCSPQFIFLVMWILLCDQPANFSDLYLSVWISFCLVNELNNLFLFITDFLNYFLCILHFYSPAVYFAEWATQCNSSSFVVFSASHSIFQKFNFDAYWSFRSCEWIYMFQLLNFYQLQLSSNTAKHSKALLKEQHSIKIVRVCNTICSFLHKGLIRSYS